MNYSSDASGGSGMIPRRLGRVAIISSVGGRRPTCLGLPAGGVVDKVLWCLRKHYFFSYRVMVAVAAGAGVLEDRDAQGRGAQAPLCGRQGLILASWQILRRRPLLGQRTLGRRSTR